MRGAWGVLPLIEFFNLTMGTKLTAAEKADLLAYLHTL